MSLNAEPSVFLVVSGRVTCGCLGQSYGAGEAFALEGRSILHGNARLWQIIGRTELENSLRRFSAQLVRKDATIAAHAARVAQLALSMGCRLGLGKARLEQLSLAAYLHDIGKLTLPTELLRTPKRLTPNEWALMRGHPHAGKQLLEATPLAFLGLMVEQHHERFDGSGYPFGLEGSEAGLESYIIAVADTFDAMTHGRPYRCARSREQALTEINRCSGVLYPREVVSAFNIIKRADDVVVGSAAVAR